MNQSELITPNEKAKELINLFNYQQRHYLRFDAKQCALIAVEEIIKAIDWHYYETPNNEIEYWQQVKHELNRL